MERAVQAKWEDPSLSTEEALRAGGFDIPPLGQADVSEKRLLDADGVSVAKRKRGLVKRLRDRKISHAKKTGDYSILEVPARTDPRMDRALEAMLADPTLSTEEGLRIGGFDFPSLEGAVIKNVVDSDNVSVAKRKHHLLRRLRETKARKGMPPQKQGRWYEARKGDKVGEVSVVTKEAQDTMPPDEREREESSEESEENGMAEETKEDAMIKDLIGAYKPKEAM